MKISVEVPDGKYCEHCIFLEIPCAYTHNCRLLDHKSLDAKPSAEVRDGKNIWIEHIAKDKDCPAFQWMCICDKAGICGIDCAEKMPHIHNNDCEIECKDWHGKCVSVEG